MAGATATALELAISGTVPLAHRAAGDARHARR